VVNLFLARQKILPALPVIFKSKKAAIPAMDLPMALTISPLPSPVNIEKQYQVVF
jgi:hypothetical protein